MIIYKQIFARGDKMIYKYNKLVRDKIPSEINAKPGRKCSYFIMNDEDYDKALDDKLTEELNEYKEDHSIEELADLMEVVTAIMKFRKISIDELKSTMDKRHCTFSFSLSIPITYTLIMSPTFKTSLGCFI